MRGTAGVERSRGARTVKRSRANSTRSWAAERRNWWIIRRARGVIAEAYRAVMGLTAAECADAEALDRMLNPARNPYRLRDAECRRARAD